MKKEEAHISLELDIKKEGENDIQECKAYPLISVILYVISAAILLLSWSWFNTPLFFAFLSILVASTLILIITQILHYLLSSPHVYKDSKSVFIRSYAGLFEMVLYTFLITFHLLEVLIGILFLKGISVWQNKSNPNQEGASAAILRIAVVLSIIFSLIIGIVLANSSFNQHPIYKAVQKFQANKEVTPIS